MITLRAPAKLNLGLKVLGRFANGYHDLKTIFCLVNLYDDIHLQFIPFDRHATILQPSSHDSAISPNTTTSNITINNHHNQWPVTDDLCYKAALLLKQYTNCPHGVRINIVKNIPTQAGMGGGSSNAASTLLGLNQLWQTNLSKTQLLHLAASLGADVPCFIENRHCLGSGIGNILKPIDLPPLYFVIIKPEINIATHLVFKQLSLMHNLNCNNTTITHSDTKSYNNNNHCNYVDYAHSNKTDDEWQDYLFASKENDLLAPAIALYSQLANVIVDIKQQLNTLNLQQLQQPQKPQRERTQNLKLSTRVIMPSMTGSGSALYLTFNDEESAKKVASILESRYNTYLAKNFW